MMNLISLHLTSLLSIISNRTRLISISSHLTILVRFQLTKLNTESSQLNTESSQMRIWNEIQMRTMVDPILMRLMRLWEEIQILLGKM